MIWLVGAGSLAIEYQKVLKDLDKEFVVIGRGQQSAQTFSFRTGIQVITGGLSNFLNLNPTLPKKVIVAVNVEELKSTCVHLINYGVKEILLEKPGGVDIKEVVDLYDFVRKKKVNVRIAYNRRYYSSVIKAKELIELDGGLQSFNFEFTEWTHKNEKFLKKKDKVLKNWFFANSTHVVDLAFYIGGSPDVLSSYVSDKIKWNNSHCVFSGAGKTKEGVIFSYNANWISAGRWSLDLLTNKGKYILCPLEKLFFQKRGSLEKKEIDLDLSLDTNYKPGFYLQLKSFIEENHNFCSLKYHYSLLKIYSQISGYNL